MGVVVVGQIARDLVLRVGEMPEPGGSADVLERLERLGGKGANQAVGLAQLGVQVALVAVAGEDGVGADVVRQARDDGIDVSAVTQRDRTALLVDVVDGEAHRRLFEDVPDSTLLSRDDVHRAAQLIAAADTVSIQLQQPSAAVLAAATLARRHGARIVADGAPDERIRDELLSAVDVLRADAQEAEMLAGAPLSGVSDVVELAHRLLRCGPQVVALAVEDVGDLVAWPGGHRLYEFPDRPVVDRTGAGDAFIAGLIAALRHGDDPRRAGDAASAAAARVVGCLGGRPDLGGLRPR